LSISMLRVAAARAAAPHHVKHYWEALCVIWFFAAFRFWSIEPYFENLAFLESARRDEFWNTAPIGREKLVGFRFSQPVKAVASRCKPSAEKDKIKLKHFDKNWWNFDEFLMKIKLNEIWL
jgi:hypothetical protein